MSERDVIRAEDRFRSGESVEAARLPEVLKAAEVAALLRVDRKTVYEAAARGELPGVIRVGRSLRFSREALLAWMASQDRPAPTKRKGAGRCP